jgi:hypothetical protein
MLIFAKFLKINTLIQELILLLNQLFLIK